MALMAPPCWPARWFGPPCRLSRDSRACGSRCKATVPLKHAECHQRVEEIACTALMQAKPLGQRLAIERPGDQFGEEIEFHAANQDFGAAEAPA